MPFNRVVGEELAKHIDPDLPGKTLIFAATDAHADIVVEQLKKAFADRYGEIEDARDPQDHRQRRQGRRADPVLPQRCLPKIAVTVDLLTTGIDVPKIANLVFLRRVNSRILYEQMLGPRDAALPTRSARRPSASSTPSISIRTSRTSPT